MQIVELLRQHNVPFKTDGQHHHARTGWVQVDCPYCASTSGFHMGLSTSRPIATCWRCGSRSLGEVLWLITDKKVGLKHSGLKYAHTSRTVVSGTYKQPTGVLPMHPLHKGYLLKRGFDCDLMETLWHVQGIQGRFDSLLWRLFIPIYMQGRPVSWTTRSIAPNPGLRYISASEDEEAVNHKTLLYGEEHCSQTVVVCEGPLDVWAVGPGAVCTFGTAFTPAQLNRIAKYSRRILCYDAAGDRAGESAVAALGAVLSMMPGTTDIVKLTTANDPGAAACAELRELREFAFGDSYGIGKLWDVCA